MYELQCQVRRIKSALRWACPMITKPKVGERLNSVNVYGVNESERTVCSPSVCFTGGTSGPHKELRVRVSINLINNFVFA
jgi:hypothetical protein